MMLPLGRCAALALLVLAGAQATTPAGKTTEVYDDFGNVFHQKKYTLGTYEQKWATGFGPYEIAVEDTRKFSGGKFQVSAKEFQTSSDTVSDHIKYFAFSTKIFSMPAEGSITFSCIIEAETYKTEPGRVIEGTFKESGEPYAQPTLEGQQAAATLHMIDLFGTGQLFDWFVTGKKAFTLTERLPATVTGGGDVGLDRAYTQIIDEVDITPGPHLYAIKFTRNGGKSTARFYLDDKLVSTQERVGVPIDKQAGKNYTGIYLTLGAGEELANQMNGFVMGHGLFSLLDAYPFQHPDRPDLIVNIPRENRIFGQGAKGTFDQFTVTTDPDDKEI